MTTSKFKQSNTQDITRVLDVYDCFNFDTLETVVHIKNRCTPQHVQGLLTYTNFGNRHLSLITFSLEALSYALPKYSQVPKCKFLCRLSNKYTLQLNSLTLNSSQNLVQILQIHFWKGCRTGQIRKIKTSFPVQGPPIYTKDLLIFLDNFLQDILFIQTDPVGLTGVRGYH